MLALMLAVTLTWTQPTTREDGSALDGGTISHYRIYRNGEEWDSTTAQTYEAARNGSYTVRCVLHDGDSSGDSNPVTVRIKKGRKK
jgi:hypothetical protein